MRLAALLALCASLGAVAGWLLGRGEPERVTETRRVTTVETKVVLRRRGNSADTELRTRGPNEIPAPDALAPAGRSPRISYVPAAGGAPALVVVRWSKGGRRDPREYTVAVWQWNWDSGWRHAFRRHYGFHIPVHATVIADLTGDGQQEIWLEVNLGTASCGRRSILATVRGRVGPVFESGDICFPRWTFRPGRLRVEDPVAPCGPFEDYRCFHGSRTREYRWNGTRFALVRTQIRCREPERDPASGCTRRR
jgi:hypothetical protein